MGHKSKINVDYHRSCAAQKNNAGSAVFFRSPSLTHQTLTCHILSHFGVGARVRVGAFLASLAGVNDVMEPGSGSETFPF